MWNAWKEMWKKMLDIIAPEKEDVQNQPVSSDAPRIPDADDTKIRIILNEPRKLNDLLVSAREMKQGNIVVVNFSKLSREDMQRAIDFLQGVAFLTEYRLVSMEEIMIGIPTIKEENRG